MSGAPAKGTLRRGDLTAGAETPAGAPNEIPFMPLLLLLLLLLPHFYYHTYCYRVLIPFIVLYSHSGALRTMSAADKLTDCGQQFSVLPPSSSPSSSSQSSQSPQSPSTVCLHAEIVTRMSLSCDCQAPPLPWSFTYLGVAALGLHENKKKKI